MDAKPFLFGLSESATTTRPPIAGLYDAPPPEGVSVVPARGAGTRTTGTGLEPVR